MKESLSALLDGECSEAELDQILAEMERDPALREQFSRQCLAREGRLGTRIRAADYGFSTRVLAALRDEPAGVLPLRERVRALPWRTGMSLAAAAAIGAIAVLVAVPQATTVQAPGPTIAAGTPAAAIPVAATATGETQYAQLEDESARQLRNYMMAYSQSRGSQTVRGMLSYARYAAYTDAKPAAAPQTAENKP